VSAAALSARPLAAAPRALPAPGWLRAGGRYGLVALAHGGLILALGAQLPSRRAAAVEQTLTVQWLAEEPRALAAAPAPPRAMPTPPVTARPPREAQPATVPVAPTPSESAAAPALPTAQAAPAAPAAATPPATPAVSAAPSPQLTPPRFDADYLHNPTPAYPALSRRLGEQGQVLLRVEVGAEGRAGQIAVERSSGSPRLDNAAIEAVRQWRFTPARLGERAVAGWVHIPFNFRLDN
jgi:periplasmic protein TonB